MEYKGFTGTIEKMEDGTGYYGKITNINDLVSYEGVDLRDLENSFIKVVENYIKDAKEKAFLFDGKISQPVQIRNTINWDSIVDASREIADRNRGTYKKDNRLFSVPAYTPAEPLTKENFWNELYAKCPAGMKVFCDWIDIYKDAVDWLGLFGDQTVEPYGNTRHAPKYHDLPFAMQIGIWIAFLEWIQQHPIYKDADITLIESSPVLLDWKSNIDYVISELQCIIYRNNEL